MLPVETAFNPQCRRYTAVIAGRYPTSGEVFEFINRKRTHINLTKAYLVKEIARQQVRSDNRHLLNARNKQGIQLFLIVKFKLRLPQMIADPLMNPANKLIHFLRIF